MSHLTRKLRRERTNAVANPRQTTVNATASVTLQYGKSHILVSGVGAPGTNSTPGNAAYNPPTPGNVSGSNPSTPGNVAGYNPVVSGNANYNPVQPGNVANYNPPVPGTAKYANGTGYGSFAGPGDSGPAPVPFYFTYNTSSTFAPSTSYYASHDGVYFAYTVYNADSINYNPSKPGNAIYNPSMPSTVAGYNPDSGGNAVYNPAIPGTANYFSPTPGNVVYNPSSPGNIQYNPGTPGNISGYNPATPGTADGSYNPPTPGNYVPGNPVPGVTSYSWVTNYGSNYSDGHGYVGPTSYGSSTTNGPAPSPVTYDNYSFDHWDYSTTPVTAVYQYHWLTGEYTVNSFTGGGTNVGNFNPSQPGTPNYNPPTPGNPNYNPTVSGNVIYNPVQPGNLAGYNPTIPGNYVSTNPATGHTVAGYNPSEPGNVSGSNYSPPYYEWWLSYDTYELDDYYGATGGYSSPGQGGSGNSVPAGRYQSWYTAYWHTVGNQYVQGHYFYSITFHYDVNSTTPGAAGNPTYNPSTPGNAYYNPTVPGNANYNAATPGNAYYNPDIPGTANYNPGVVGTVKYNPPTAGAASAPFTSLGVLFPGAPAGSPGNYIPDQLVSLPSGTTKADVYVGPGASVIIKQQF